MDSRIYYNLLLLNDYLMRQATMSTIGIVVYHRFYVRMEPFLRDEKKKRLRGNYKYIIRN